MGVGNSYDLGTVNCVDIGNVLSAHHAGADDCVFHGIGTHSIRNRMPASSQGYDINSNVFGIGDQVAPVVAVCDAVVMLQPVGHDGVENRTSV